MQELLLNNFLTILIFKKLLFLSLLFPCEQPDEIAIIDLLYLKIKTPNTLIITKKLLIYLSNIL